MFRLPELPYDYAALEPAISESIMRLHHQKHHQAYVDKLNAALEGRGASSELTEILGSIEQLPSDIQVIVRNNGGGHFNHSLFWQMMTPDGGGEPGGQLGAMIAQRYGSFQGFVDEFSAAATGLFGSGWVWLMPDLTLVTTQNQDNPIMNGQPEPILGLDVWEHAYYLDYHNQRDRYIAAWWDVVSWGDVEKRHASGIIS